MKKCPVSILFLGKEDNEYVDKALEFCENNFRDVLAYVGTWGEPLPEGARNWSGDYIVSYLSRWIIPKELLSKAKIAAINFHPAPPEYPGIGCNNFALYEDAREFGVTCHVMAPRVDTGAIIAVKRFPVFPSDNVATLFSRTHDYQIGLFYDVVGIIANGQDLPKSDERWTRKPFSRQEFDALGRITPNMSKEEIARRVRAIEFGHWKPTLELEGYTFELKSSPNRSAASGDVSP